MLMCVFFHLDTHGNITEQNQKEAPANLAKTRGDTVIFYLYRICDFLQPFSCV